PSINASLAMGVLWPPNHDLLTAGFTFTATDNSPGAISTSVDVFSNEDDVTPAGGDQSPDAKSIASGTLRLRAERNANGNGRVYLIRITATDAFANTSRTCIAAVVPKSQSAGDVNSVNAAAQAATAAQRHRHPARRLLHRRRRPAGRTKAVVRGGLEDRWRSGFWRSCGVRGHTFDRHIGAKERRCDPFLAFSLRVSAQRLVRAAPDPVSAPVTANHLSSEPESTKTIGATQLPGRLTIVLMSESPLRVAGNPLVMILTV